MKAREMFEMENNSFLMRPDKGKCRYSRTKTIVVVVELGIAAF